MSMFSTGRRSDNEPVGAIRPAGQLSILAPGLRVVGEVDVDGVVKVEGRVEGALRGKSQVIVAPGGVVQGAVTAKEVIVSGRIEGDVTATGRVEVQEGGAVQGDLTAPRIVVHEGGEVNGRFRMQQQRPVVTATTPKPLQKTA